MRSCFAAFGTSRLARTVCAAPTGAANGALYGKMPGVTYEDYVHARLIVLWGVNPSASGIHLVPFIKEARSRGAMLVVIDPRATSLARQADLHLAPRPGTDLPLALSMHKYLFDRGLAAAAFLDEHARGVDGLRARADEWSIPRAAKTCEIDAADLDRFAALYASSSPAVIRCGWGLERNRNGGSAAAAVMALPAVAGKFGVRGGGFSMSNSAALGIKAGGLDERHARAADPPRQHESPRPGAPRLRRPAGGDALRLQLQSAGDDAGSESRAAGLAAREPLHRRVRAGVHRHRAATPMSCCRRRRSSRTTTSPRAMGRSACSWCGRSMEPSGEARPNAEVFSELAGRLGVGETGAGNRHALPRCRPAAQTDSGPTCWSRASSTPPYGGAPVQFVDVFPLTPDNKIDLYPAALVEHTRDRLYVYQPDPETDQYPLALISPASEKTVSSTLGELRERAGDAADAPVRRLRAQPLDRTIRSASSTISARSSALWR